MKRTVIAALTLASLFTLTVVAQKPSTLEAQLGAIINQAEVEGKYEGAIANYKKFLTENGKNKSLAAKAQYHLGLAYEKLGNAEAKSAYEQVIRVYSDQPVATQARQRLAGLRSTPEASLTTRLIPNVSSAGSITPDGRFLAFVDEADHDLQIRDMTTGQVIRPIGAKHQARQAGVGITAAVSNMALSPDGRQVAYGWNVLLDSGKGEHQLRVISTENNGQARTLVNSSEVAFIVPMAWALDGKSIFATTAKPDSTWQLSQVSLADGSLKTLKSLGWRSAAGSLSPDGKFIAYSALAVNPSTPRGDPADPTDMHIYVISSDGSMETEVVKGASINDSPVWMPDGKGLLFASNRSGGTFGIWSISMQDGKPNGNAVQVMPNTGRIRPVGMTRSGSYYYVAPPTFSSQIVIADVNAKDVREANGRESATILGNNPVWSPDGKQIAFTRSANPTGAREGRGSAWLPTESTTLLVYSVDTADEKLYSPGRGFQIVPRTSFWFADGKGFVQILQDSQGNRSLYRVDGRSGEFKRMAAAPTMDSIPVSVSSDGRTVYLMTTPTAAGPLPPAQSLAELVERENSRPKDRIFAIDANNGQQREVFRGPLPKFGADGSIVGRLTVSRDGKTLYMVNCEDLTQDPTTPATCHRLFAVDLGTGQEREIFASKEHVVFAALSLSADGRTLRFVNPDGAGKLRFAEVGVDGKGYRELGFVDRAKSGEILSWTADNNAILVTDKPRAPSLQGVMLTPVANGNLIRIPVSGGTPQVLSSSIPNGVAFFSPDRLHVAVDIANERIPQKLWALDHVSEFLKTTR